MKDLNLKTQKFDRNLYSHIDSPFIEKNGLLEFNPKFIEPEFLTTWTFETHLYDEQVAIDHFVITFPSHTQLEKNGLLEFNPKFIEPEFLTTWTFETHLYDEQVAIDHFVITFPSHTQLEKYAESFYPFGAKIVEGPDLFPINFCSTNINVPSDLWMHLMTLLMPAGGLVVLCAPHAAGDQKNRFQEERGLAAVHHVAIRVENVQNAATIWQKKRSE